MKFILFVLSVFIPLAHLHNLFRHGAASHLLGGPSSHLLGGTLMVSSIKTIQLIIFFEKYKNN
jgi:hypothetical protein